MPGGLKGAAAAGGGWSLRVMAAAAVAGPLCGLGLIALTTQAPPEPAFEARIQRLHDLVPTVKEWMSRHKR